MSQPILALLANELSRRKSKSSRYSIRAFARDLGVESSTLSKIISGKRKLTFSAARQILDVLGIEKSKRNELLLALDDPKQFTPAPNAYRELSATELDLMSDWQYYAILCALEFPGQKFTATGIAEEIGCDRALVESALRLLLERGLVSKARGRYLVTEERLTTSRKLSSPALVKAHRAYLHKAVEALERTDLRADSDFSGITMAVCTSKLPEATRRIREFRRSLAAYLGDGEKNAVFRVNIQLFPLRGRSKP